MSEQKQEEVPHPSREHYLKAKTRKVTLAGFWGDGFNPDWLVLRDFSQISIFEPHPNLLLVKFSYWLTFRWGHSMIICTFQMATLLLLPLAISEDWNVLWKIAYTRHKMEAEDMVEELCSSMLAKWKTTNLLTARTGWPLRLLVIGALYIIYKHSNCWNRLVTEVVGHRGTPQWLKEISDSSQHQHAYSKVEILNIDETSDTWSYMWNYGKYSMCKIDSQRYINGSRSSQTVTTQPPIWTKFQHVHLRY